MTQFKLEKMREHWDDTSEQYSQDRSISSADEYVLGLIRLSSGQKILELGAGSGITGRELLLRNSGIHYYNLDLSEKFIRIALKNQGSQARAIWGDAAAMPFKAESMDCVLEMDAIHHFPREMLELPVKEISRVLKPGGIVYLAEDWGKSPENEKEEIVYSLQNRRKLPGRGLEYHPSDDEWQELFANAGMITRRREHVSRPLNLEYFRTLESPEAEAEYKKLLELWGDQPATTYMTIHVFEKVNRHGWL